ncbi:MAG: hypothetical protein ACYC6M_03035 [Terriglobales bacterium]
MSEPMKPPVTYQGGKGRLAGAIVAAMQVPQDTHFTELCCGSGAVSLAIIDAGHPPGLVTMVDIGPWGLFWQQIGDGTIDRGTLARICGRLTDPLTIKMEIECLFRAPVPADPVPTFLALQAAAIGGAAVGIAGSRWTRGSGFRDYWLPTATSSRRSPVNPMMPMPATILERVEEIARRCRGIHGARTDATAFRAAQGYGYIDPPYAGTTGYGSTLDAAAVARRFPGPCWVSEGRALSEDAVLLSSGRAKGGITGDRKREANAEWLSCFARTLNRAARRGEGKKP